MISVVIVDDHTLVCEIISRLIDNIRGIELIGQAHTGAEAIEVVTQLQPNVVLLDFCLPDTKAFGIIPKLIRQAPDSKLLSLTMYDSEITAAKLLQTGVAGFLLKNSEPRELEDAIRKVHVGQIYVTSHMAERLALRNGDMMNSPFENLSQKELTVMQLCAEGKSVSAIAESMKIHNKTVSTYRRRAFYKLGIKRDSELVKLATEHELPKSKTSIKTSETV